MTRGVERALHRVATANQGCRILVLGNGGSGKTSLASTLAAVYGLKLISVDALRWDDEWTQRSSEDVLVRLRAALASSRWVAEDGALRWLHVLVPPSDIILWLDADQRRCAFRVARRAFRRRLGTEPRERAKPEPWTLVLRHCRWCLRYNAERRPTYEEIQRANPARTLRLKKARSVQELLKALTTASSADGTPYGGE
ncbi:MAG: AAA family ATPase [Polyangiaceae bacterium]